MRSGLSTFCLTEFHVWNSMTFICAAATSACADGISSSASCSAHSPGSSLTPGIVRTSACFWKNSSWPTPSGARTSDTGRDFRCGNMKSAMPA